MKNRNPNTKWANLYQHCECGHSLYTHRDNQCEHPHDCGCTGYRGCECSPSE